VLLSSSDQGPPPANLTRSVSDGRAECELERLRLRSAHHINILDYGFVPEFKQAQAKLQANIAAGLLDFGNVRLIGMTSDELRNAYMTAAGHHRQHGQSAPRKRHRIWERRADGPLLRPGTVMRFDFNLIKQIRVIGRELHRQRVRLASAAPSIRAGRCSWHAGSASDEGHPGLNFREETKGRRTGGGNSPAALRILNLSGRDRRRRALPGQEALTAEHRTALRRLERNRGIPPALRAGRHGFRFREARARSSLALGFAALAPLRLVLEILVVEEVLFSRCEREVRSAINALERTILKLRHGNWSPYELELVSDCAGGGGEPSPPLGYSTSRRFFFRLRLRASACLARSFSPGFK
jgi:hypothetical protein